MTDTGLRQMMMKRLLLLLPLPHSHSHPPPCSEYPEIRKDAERQEYKREFDVDLREYKRLCAEMDDINDQLNKLSRQLDTLDDTSAKYQVRRRPNSPPTSISQEFLESNFVQRTDGRKSQTRAGI